LIDIDDLKDDVKDKELLNKLLDEGFYLIPLPSIHFLDYKDVFIPVRSEEMEKEVLAAMFVTAAAATPKTAAKQGAMSLLAATSELRLD